MLSDLTSRFPRLSWCSRESRQTLKYKKSVSLKTVMKIIFKINVKELKKKLTWKPLNPCGPCSPLVPTGP